MKKRYLSLLLVCICILLLGTISVSAAETTEDGFSYTVSAKGTCTITGYSGTETELVIPAEIDGYPVVTIGESAFEYCSSLISITLPESLTSIGESAFYRCTGLTSITLPEGLTAIEHWAFFECNRLIRVYISDMAAYLSCTYDGRGSNPMCCAKQLFLNGKRVEGEITIPEGVTQIPQHAFCRQAITEITIPASLTSIESAAFADCTSLTSITIPEGVTSIGSGAFQRCTSLSSITLPEGITSIESYTFYGCSSLTSITLPDSLTSIKRDAFAFCDSLIGITIPKSITSIEQDTFEGCTSLSSITLPEGITSIGHDAFYGCTSLTSITLPDSVTSIENRAFQNCTSLTSITLPDSVTSIENRAFQNCTSLTSVVIPANIVSIEEDAFYTCTALKTVYYDGTDFDWDLIYIADGNEPLLNARRQNCVRVKLTDEAGKTQTLICEPGQPISISQVEAIYKRRVTLYTDAALTQPFDLSTPITERITLYVQLGEELVGAALRGQVCSYNPQMETVIQLLQNGVEKYSVTIPAEASGSGQITQAFSIPGVAEGTYDLVVSKAGHLTFIIQGVVMGTEDLDLTTNSNAAISTITLPAGDLNGDGSINTKDRTVLNRNLNLAGSDIGNALADITGDGLVNSKDRTILTKNLNKSEENDCIIDYQEGSHET